MSQLPADCFSSSPFCLSLVHRLQVDIFPGRLGIFLVLHQFSYCQRSHPRKNCTAKYSSRTIVRDSLTISCDAVGTVYFWASSSIFRFMGPGSIAMPPPHNSITSTTFQKKNTIFVAGFIALANIYLILLYFHEGLIVVTAALKGMCDELQRLQQAQHVHHISNSQLFWH